MTGGALTAGKPGRTCLLAGLFFWLASAIWAEPLRVATFNTELSRDGPGLLYRDLRRQKDPQIAAVIDVIAATAPDILLLQGIDWDHDGLALSALAEALERAGVPYPHRLALMPNTGLPTNHDMNGDGYRGDPEDAQSFGRFTGQNGMALLSTKALSAVVDHSATLWADVEGTEPPRHPDGSVFPSPEAFAAQRLPHTGLWLVSVQDVGRLILFQAGPPVFDGEEDRNGLRNAAELGLIKTLAETEAATGPVIVLGGANLDPLDGEGRHEAVRALLASPVLQDPAPQSRGGALAGDQGHAGRDAQDTVDWPGVGRLRVSHVLPDKRFTVLDQGIHWPAPHTPGYEAAQTASRHRLVWVDLDIR